jgi:uncharacterized repeat protein (TIGR01451 family)
MNLKRLIVLFAFVFSFVLPQSLVAHAEGVSHLKINVTTDKKSYSEKDEIKYTITITNTSDSRAKDVVVTSTIPEGLEVLSKDVKRDKGNVVWKIEKIDPFGKAALTFTAKAQKSAGISAPPVKTDADQDKDSSGTAPKTGDNTSFLPYYLLLVISAGGLIWALVALKKKSLKKSVTTVVILAMILPSFTVAKAGELKETIKETKTITVNNKEYKLTVTVESTLDIDKTLVLKAQRSFGVPQLEWNAIDGASYQVKRGKAPEKLEVIAEKVIENSYEDESSTPKDQYYYQVAAMKYGKAIHQSNVVTVLAFIDGDNDGIADGDEQTYKTDVSKTDTDGDGLTDGEEVYVVQTNPLKKDTDGDGLLDSYEVSFLNESNTLDPLKKDTDDNGTIDGKEDIDEDGLTNLQEQEYKTNPFKSDTDKDHLSDSDEINKHHTDPLLTDTDKDALDDDSELRFKTDPLKPDTDGDGILDGDEKRDQEVQSSELNATVSFNATGDAQKTTTLERDDFAQGLMGEEGMVGKPVDITTESNFDKASLTFSYDPNVLGDIVEDNLSVFYFNRDTWQLELVENQTLNKENHTVTANLPHFSTYILADKARWQATIIEDPVAVPDTCSKPEEEKDKPLDLVFVIDSSGSMVDNDPNNYRISGAKEIINSLKGSDQAAVVGDQGAVVDFDSYATLLQKLTDDKDLLKAAVDKIDSSGGTNIGAGVSAALTELKNRGRENANQVIILLTDGVGSYNTSYTVNAKDEGIKIFTIGLGDNLDETLLKSIAAGTEADYYHTVSAEKIPELFEKARDVSQETDTDGDCIVDWIEKASEREGGYVVQNTLGNFSTHYSSNFMKEHSDTDGLDDLTELVPLSNPTILAALPNLVTNPGKTKVHLKEWPRSNPMSADTDNDSDHDKFDDKPTIPFKRPVMLIHGIRSNTGDTFGADAWLDNGNVVCFKLCQQDTPDFTKKVPADKTATGTSYKNGESTAYNHLDAQFIKEIDRDEEYLAPYLIDNGYEENKNLFIFNWEHADRIRLASSHLKSYLNSLVKDIKKKNYGDIDITNDHVNGDQIHFSLVTHSAGGLVSRYYIENLMDKNDAQIDKLITIDTPHTGSNDKHNGGTFGVLRDIDRDDSPLIYSDSDNRNSGDEDTLPLNTKNKGDADYYLIGGLVGRYDRFGLDKIYYPKDKEPSLFTLKKASDITTDGKLYDEMKSKLAGVGIDMPKVDVEHTDYFGDNIVELGSQLGIPAGFQKKRESDLKYLEYSGAYVLVGRNEHSEHGNITKQKKVHAKIVDVLEK